MPCIFRVTDPILKSLIGETFNSMSELRDAFESLVNKNSVIPLNIRSNNEGFSRRKFAKVYRDSISEGIKVQIVMPGQEYLNELSFGRGFIQSPEFYGTADTKTLTFGSIDNFLAFYLANYLFVDSVDNVAKLTNAVKTILSNTIKRLEDPNPDRKVFAIEDLSFADSVVEYAKILYDFSGQEIPDEVNDFYERVREKVEKYHQGKREQQEVQVQNEKNLQKPSIPKENLVYFNAGDVVKGKANDKPGSKLRQELIKGIKDPTQYQVRLSRGSTEYFQDNKDDGTPLTEAEANSGVVGILTDLEGNPVYLTKEGLTTDPSQARRFKYKIGEEEKESSIVYFLLNNEQYKSLKSEFLRSEEPYIFQVHSTKTEGFYTEHKTFKESGYDLETLRFNDLKDQPLAGVAYVINNGRRVIVNPTTLNEEEIQEITQLLTHTYEDENQLQNVVAYLNDLLSVSDKLIKESNGEKGREISFFPGVDRIWIRPERIREGNDFISVESEPLKYEENPELIQKSLRSARIRLRKKPDVNGIQLEWNKYVIRDGEVNQLRVDAEAGVKFYEDHLSSIATEVAEGYQLVTFSERMIPKKKPIIGMLQVEKGKEYSLGDIQQLVFYPLTNSKGDDTSERRKQKEYFRNLWQSIYNLSDAKFVFEDFEGTYSGTYAKYDPSIKTVTLHYSNIMKMRDNFKMVSGLVEEVLHNITMNRMSEYQDTLEFKQLEEDWETAKELLNTYKETEEYQKLTDEQKKDLDFRASYYIQNIYEFVVGISNPHFRFFLRLGESRNKNLLDQVIESVKKLLNTILKGVAPSLYTDVTTDLFNFLLNKPTQIPEVTLISEGQIEDDKTVADLELLSKRERPRRKIEKKEEKEIKKYFAPPIPEDIDLTTIRGLDAEIGQYLINSGQFGEFVQGELVAQEVWVRFYNNYVEEYEQTNDDERLGWLEYFFDNELELKKAWGERSKLFAFSNDKLYIGEDLLALDSEESSENPEEMEGKDPGYNRVDSEQNKTRLELADKFAKMFIKLTPKIENREIVRVKGLTQLSDFTILWNKLQKELEGTINYDEQLERLEQLQDRIPEASIIIERLDKLQNNAQDNLILNSIQNSFSTVKVPVWIPFFEEIKNEKGTITGYKFSLFEQASLDSQNIELSINAGFREFSKKFQTTVVIEGNEVPTIDNKRLALYLKSQKSSKDLIPTYREMGFDIPDNPNFLTNSNLTQFHQYLIRLLEERAGNSFILNGEFTGYIKSTKLWEGPLNRLQESKGISTSFNQVVAEISKYTPLTVSNMTRNAEGQNQSILLSWSSWMINNKELNQKRSFRSKNPIFKYSLLSRANGKNPVTPVNLNGSQYNDGFRYQGKVSMDLDYIPYLRQEVASYLTRGFMEISRVETKNSTFGYKFSWEGNNHPIPLDKFKTNSWESEAVAIFLTNNQEENPKGYLRGELERIQLEINNPVQYYSKYDKIKTDFHLFTYLPEIVKQDKQLPFKEFYQKHKQTLRDSLIENLKQEVQAFKDHVKNQTGIPLTSNHPIFNVPVVQEKIKEVGLDNFLIFLVTNRRIYQIEHAITGHGDIGQQDKYYKRSGSNISTGVPISLNSKTLTTLNNTLHKTFTGRVPTGKSLVIPDDYYSYDDPLFYEGVKDSLTKSYKAFGINKSEQEIEQDTKKKTDPYQRINVADGQGFMTPDFGRMLMMAIGNWTVEREEGFYYQMITWKKNQGISLTKEELDHVRIVDQKIKDQGIYWNFPPLKMQYRGPFYPKQQTNVQLEGLDKFSLAWLWPDELEGKKFGPILNAMMEQGIDYGKFESGTKIASPIPDDLIGMVERGEVITINSEHDIDLKYMKEQVKAGEGFKDKMPMSTQARKLIVSNLRTDTPEGRDYLTERIKEGVRKWKETQAEMSSLNKQRLMDEISTNGFIDNKKLADKVKQELTKRELPESLQAIFQFYGERFYTRFEQALSPQLVDTLIYSLLKNNIVRPKFPGEHYIQITSTLFDNVGKRDLKFYQYTNDLLSPNDRIIFGHPGIGKTFLRQTRSDFIDVDHDYKEQHKKQKALREKYKKSNSQEDKLVWENFITEWWNQVKSDAKVSGKKILVSNLPILRMFPQDFDKIITVSKETFVDRAKQRNDYKAGETEDWKKDLDKEINKFDSSKIIITDKYLSELFELSVKPAECKITLSGEFLKLLNLKEVNNNLPPEYDQLTEFEKLEYKRYVLNQLLLMPEFVDKHQDSLTVYSSRIPGQGYNSMDIFTIKEFLPTYNGPAIVLPPQATKKSGTDFDFDKLPTITPELSEKGNLSESKVNEMIQGAKQILLDPINFHRLVTPNSTDELDDVISTTLERLGKTVKEPKFDSIFLWTSHLDKWLAMKMKNPLGIGATNNTFYTLQQDADVTIEDQFEVVNKLFIPTTLPFKTEEKPFYYPLIGDVDKLEYINQFINITVDVASNDAIGYTGLRQENSALLLFLIERGVPFDQVFYFINQPIIFKYHQLLNEFQGKGSTLSEARNEAIKQLLGIEVRVQNKYGKWGDRSRKDIYGDVYNLYAGKTFNNLESSISSEIPQTFNASQKSYLAFYLIGLEMAEKQRDAQSYNNFDTSPSANYFYSEMRERMSDKIYKTGLFDILKIQEIHDNSVISHLNVHEEFDRISKQAFPIKRDEKFIETAINLGGMIYNSEDRDKFFRKFDNDYLLAIIQNFGILNKERIEKNLTNLMERWDKIKKSEEVKDLVITKYVTPNYSKKGLVSPSLFLGLDGDAQTLDQISKDLRVMYDSNNKEVRDWTKDFIETGIYTTGFTKSPVYYLNALPHEIVTPILKQAFDNYQPSEQFIQMFATRFLYQRGMEFSQYFLDIYREDRGRYLSKADKQTLFNQEAWRYTDYKMDVESLVSLEKQPDMTQLIFQEHPSPNYQDRTGINAQADATIAFAVNFNSRGEIRTKEEVIKRKRKYISVDAKSKEVTSELVQRIVNELKSVNAKSLNIAGNGIYESGIGTQQEVDDFVFNLLQKVTLQYPIESIRTGGQTGYDEAGAKAGIKLGIPTTILAPKGWKFRDKTGTDISNEQKFKERFVSQPTQLEFTKGKKGIGEEISSYKDDLAYALTNPVFTSPTGSTWSRTWTIKQQEWRNYLSAGIQFEGKSYRDVEEAYQKNKSKYPIGKARDNFMLNLIEIKLRTYPKLVEEINKRGGVNYLTDSTHQPTKQNSHWETGGDNAFIKLLTQAYLNVTGVSQSSQPIQPKQLDLFEEQKDCNLDIPF